MAKDYMAYSDLVGYKHGFVTIATGWGRNEVSTKYFLPKRPITNLEIAEGADYNILTRKQEVR